MEICSRSGGSVGHEDTADVFKEYLYTSWKSTTMREKLWAIPAVLGIIFLALAVLNLTAGATWLSTGFQLLTFLFFGIAVFTMD